MSDRRRRTVDATVALLAAMPEAWLQDVLDRLGASGVVALPEDQAKPRRVCSTCGKPYALCRRLAQATGDDHEFELKG